MVIFEMIGLSLLIPIMSLFAPTSEISSNNSFVILINNFLLENNLSSSFVLLAFVIIYFIKTMVSFLYYYWNASFTSRMVAKLSKSLLTIYLLRPFEFHLKKNSAKLVRNTFSEIGTIVGAGIHPIMTIVVEILVVFGISVILFLVNPILTTVISITLSMLAMTIFFGIRPFLYRWGKMREKADGKRIEYITQGLGGVKEILIHAKEKVFLKKFSEVNDISAQSTMKFSAFQNLPRLLIELVLILGFSMYCWLFIIPANSQETDFVFIGVFIVAILRILPSINKILTAVQLMKYGLPYVEVLYQDFKEKNDHHKAAASDQKFNFDRLIDINNICYSYEQNNIILNNLSFQINKGDKISIIGESGAGKSTLVNILLGLLRPSSGEIKVDEMNIYDDLKGWQSQLGYVSQDIYLLDDTILNNIALWVDNKDIDMMKVNESLKLAALDGLIENLPNGLQTIIGENGVRFSGGERQRLGIARALYSKPSVLILDEITSALDVETEKKVMDSIYSLDSNITIILITHKASSSYGCNKVLSVKNGAIKIG